MNIRPPKRLAKKATTVPRKPAAAKRPKKKVPTVKHPHR